MPPSRLSSRFKCAPRRAAHSTRPLSAFQGATGTWQVVFYLNGTTLDYVTEGLTGGFTFVNPNAKSSCGCGHSFTA